MPNELKYYPSWITERFYGGKDTAEGPLTERQSEKWPEGPNAPMVDGVCNILIDKLKSFNSHKKPCLVFLVGGAGNGKSRIARAVYERIKCMGGHLKTSKSEHAQRSYECELNTNNQILKIINDATIPNQDQTLLRDITFALRETSCLLVCVNRGVLLSNPPNIPINKSCDEFTAALLIRKWLRGDNELKDGNVELQFDKQRQSHYAFSSIYINEICRGFSHVVYLDQASLLEPGTTSESQQIKVADTPLDAEPLKMEPIFSRCHEKGGSARFAETLSKFAQTYFKEYAEQLGNTPFDPVYANAKSLSSPICASAWCAMLRGAEIISGSHFTYRELWALASHAIVGPCGPNNKSLKDLRRWVSKRLSAVYKTEQKINENKIVSVKELNNIVSLSTLRTHMLLFDADRNDVLDWWPNSSFYDGKIINKDALSSVALCDPLRDFGDRDGSSHKDMLDRLNVMDNFASVTEILPGKNLSEEDPLVAAYWNNFDTLFEKAIAMLVNPEYEYAMQVKRDRYLDWYGKYLFRLVALSRGWPAHSRIVDIWQKIWQDAIDGVGLSEAHTDKIRSILLPTEDQKYSYLPILRPSIDLISPGETVLTLGVRLNRLDFAVKATGNSIYLSLSNPGHDPQVIAETTLDFHLLREALIKQNKHGFSESLELIEPRVDRIRSSVASSEINSCENSRYQARSGGNSPICFDSR